VPFAAMLLGDLGAEVVRISRPGGFQVLNEGAARVEPEFDFMSRNRIEIEVDLKSDGASALWNLIDHADVLMEGFRPGVMERLGFGAAEVHSRNPQIVYGRLAGWDREGDVAMAPSHDINVLAMTGALHCFGRPDARPLPPLNLVADFGGGALFAFSILAGLISRDRTGRGPQLDASMQHAVASLMTSTHGLYGQGTLDVPGTNYVDGGAPFYNTYRTKDGRYLAVGAVEPKFYEAFLHVLGLEPEFIDRQADQSSWSADTERIAGRIAMKNLTEWTDQFSAVEACVSPTLTPHEALQQSAAARIYVGAGKARQPAPFPHVDGKAHTVRPLARATATEILDRWVSEDS
jgi:alpha-methylacyl-CoA racemase